MNAMLKKIFSKRILKRIYLERAGEPFIYNLASFYQLFFGDFITKIDYDLVPRQPYAFGINEAFKLAKEENIKELLLLEFGVASGAGLFNMAYLANKLSLIYKIPYKVIGFDTGKGMPHPIDYRDHPEKYRFGDFPSSDKLKNLPPNTYIYYGDIKDGIAQFKQDYQNKDVSIGFISVDVDYYSSTLKCFDIFQFSSEKYLSKCPLYFDDVNNPDHNEFCGELLAIKEFNTFSASNSRKITRMNQLRNWRIFKNALWLDQMYYLHIFDHPLRHISMWENKGIQILENPY